MHQTPYTLIGTGKYAVSLFLNKETTAAQHYVCTIPTAPEKDCVICCKNMGGDVYVVEERSPD